MSVTSAGNILVIDDEAAVRNSISASLRIQGFLVDTANNLQEAEKAVEKEYYDVIILDICLGDSNGLLFMGHLASIKCTSPVIVISGNASLADAARSTKLGAYDFLEKPFGIEKLFVTLENCLEHTSLLNRLKSIEQSSKSEIIGDHPSITQLRLEISKIATTGASVLISGETGTGKELIASGIHRQSARAKKNFITVNCSAIPENLIESALFGHIKGAFTGAISNRKGYFEEANGGTVFLDEIADLPLNSQASLLRLLENREVQKVGSDKVTHVDVRILAASHKNLIELIRQGEFREDLYYRLNVVPLVAPPLRDRASDIPLLTEHFLIRIAERLGDRPKSIDPKCHSVLSRYRWPGNIRELLNVIERMIILSGSQVTLEDIPTEISSPVDLNIDLSDDLSLREYNRIMEREFILKKLKRYGGNVTLTAKALGIDRSHLHKKIDQYDVKKSFNFD